MKVPSPGLCVAVASDTRVTAEREPAGRSEGLLIAYFLRMAIGIWRAEARLCSRPSYMSESPNHEKLRRLLDVRRTLAAESDYERLLERVLEEGRAITGARYAALGVLDEERVGLERFLTSGVDAATREAIGEPPRGRGVLGVLMLDPRPLRLADVAEHPDSYRLPSRPPADAELSRRADHDRG